MITSAERLNVFITIITNLLWLRIKNKTTRKHNCNPFCHLMTKVHSLDFLAYKVLFFPNLSIIGKKMVYIKLKFLFQKK